MRKKEIEFSHDLLVEIPSWVKESIRKKCNSGMVHLVSAVCPDYEKREGKYTYDKIGINCPEMVYEHFTVVGSLLKAMPKDIDISYSVTLADTEYDLPLVMEHLVEGRTDIFVERCQKSCDNILRLGLEKGLPVVLVKRFTDIFPNWSADYDQAHKYFCEELDTDSTMRFNLESTAYHRSRLYFTMAGGRTSDIEYAKSMVLRQWAQYAVWGENAERVFGKGIVMLNHTTPNLGRVNLPFFRKGRERIPILQLRSNTLP